MWTCIEGPSFIPFIAATALGDTDPVVKDSYMRWIADRRKHNLEHLNDADKNTTDLQNWGERSCFASALALLLSGDLK